MEVEVPIRVQALVDQVAIEALEAVVQGVVDLVEVRENLKEDKKEININLIARNTPIYGVFLVV